jgi:hypothetical protein
MERRIVFFRARLSRMNGELKPPALQTFLA